MSPEQCQGSTTIDARSDLYSLGVLIFEVLTKRPPFQAEDPLIIMLKQISDPIPALPEQHAILKPLVQKLTAKEPDERYNCAGSFLSDLKAILQTANSDFSQPKRLEVKTTGTTSPLSLPKQADTPLSGVIATASITLIGLVGMLSYLIIKQQPPFITQSHRCSELSEADIQQRDLLLELAQSYTDISRLTHPPGSNALDTYLAILDIDPCNEILQDTVSQLRTTDHADE